MFRQSVSVSTKSKWAAIILVLTVGAIHLALAPEYLEETPYVGALFIANVAAAAIVAVGIARDRAWAWPLGMAVAGGAFVAFIESNTIGMPGLPKEWEVSGFVALAVEALFLALAASALRHRGPAPRPRIGDQITATGVRTTL